MTAELRDALRAEIDRAARERIDWTAEPRCSACGIELYDEEGEPQYLPRCRRCSDRRLRRAYREREWQANGQPAQLVLAIEAPRVEPIVARARPRLRRPKPVTP